MQATSRAPAGEPDSVKEAEPAGGPDRRVPGAGAGVSLRGLSHSFVELEVLDALGLEVAAREVVAIVGPSGCGKSTLLELIAACASRPPVRSRSRARSAGEARLARSAYMPQRDLLFPWLSAIDNAGLALRNRGATKARGAHRGGAPLPPVRARGVRAGDAGRALRRDAPAGRLPSHPARGEAGTAAGRAIRLARHDHPRRDAGVARRGAARRAAHRPPRHPRRRGGALRRRPGAGPLAPAREDRRPSSPIRHPEARGRRRSPTPAFADLRERALVALAEGRGQRKAGHLR